MVSREENCNVDIVLNSDDSSSLSHCNVSSLDLNTFSTENALHACVDSPCISCISSLHKSHDDMLAMSSCHEQNASISSSCLLSNNVEETEHSMRQETLINEDSRISSSSSSGMHICLMARGSKVSPTLNPNTSSNDESDDDEQDEDAMLKGLFKVRCTLRGDALVKFDFLMDSLNDREESIVEMESHMEDEKRRFNLLVQELKNERCISQGLKQQMETFELDEVKNLDILDKAHLMAQELDA